MQNFAAKCVYRDVRQKKMKADTSHIVAQLKRGEPQACNMLISAYGNYVFRIVQRIVQRTQDAEEVYQDVFLKVVRGISSFDDSKASLATWIGRIAYNEAVNFARRTTPYLIDIDDININCDMPDEAESNEQIIAQLESAIEMLTPHERTIIAMFYFDDLSLRDIAYITGIPAATVGSQLSRIRQKLYRNIQTLQR